MNMPQAAGAAPLEDRMLVMDVVDTLRHGVELFPNAEDDPGDGAILERLRTLYRRLGLEVSDDVLAEGIAAMADNRFAYQPPRRGVAARLARLYVSRGRWGPAVTALGVIVVLALGGYLFGYRPYEAAQTLHARLELTEELPARMDALYDDIFNETKVQTAADDAADLRDRGKAAAQKGDRAGAEKAVADLTVLRDQLHAAYTLRVVDEAGVKPGFWTFPPNNSEATNYYIVVEPIGSDGQPIRVPVTNDQTGTTQTISRWGLRVPQSVYESVMADKRDDGTIERNLVGFKQDGFTDTDYVIPVLGGVLTQW